LDHLHDLQLEAVVECPAFGGHEKLLDRCIFHLSRCPGKLDHYTMPSSSINGWPITRPSGPRIPENALLRRESKARACG
ncbi:hypothetical protein FIV37_24885, partial [Pseudomonas gessardii]|nr:hypothetical protein [Pseudomonas gessardii]